MRSPAVPTGTPRLASHLESQVSPGLRKCRASAATPGEEDPGARPARAHPTPGVAGRRSRGRAASPRPAPRLRRGRAAGPGGHFESEQAAARWLRGHEVGRRAAGAAELLLAPTRPLGDPRKRRAQGAHPAQEFWRLSALGHSKYSTPAQTHLPSPWDPVPQSLSDLQGCKGESSRRKWGATGSLAGTLWEASSPPN